MAMPIIFFLFLTWLKIYNWIDLFLDLIFAVHVAFYIEIHFKYIKTSITSPSIKTMSFLLLFLKRGLECCALSFDPKLEKYPKQIKRIALK